MEKYNTKPGDGQKLKENRYSPEEIKEYLSEVRLIITDSEGTMGDEKALEAIEKCVFSIEKSGSCS